MNFYDFKLKIKEAILEQYGTIKAFCSAYKELGFTSSKISIALNPSRNTSLEIIQRIMDCLGMELRATYKPLKPVDIKSR